MTRLEKKLILIGITVVVTIIIVIMGYSFLKGNNPLKKDRIFYIIYSDIQGLSETAQVRMSGKTVGQVKTVKFYRPDTNLLLVEIIIEDKVKIPYGSIAKIVSTDMLGTKAIQIIPNYNSRRWAKSGDTLRGEVEKTLEQVIMDKLTPLEQAVNNLNTLLTGLNNTLDSSMIADIHTSMTHLRHSLYVMDTLIAGNRVNTSINALAGFSQNLANQQDTINQILSESKQIVTQINQAGLKHALTELDSTITAINQILRQIQQGQGTLGQLYTEKELYEKLDSISTKLNTLLDDILSNPKHYIKVSVF